MVSSSAAVASSPVALHFEMLPAPTKVAGPDAAATLVADGILGAVGAAGPRSSRQVMTTRTAPRTRRNPLSRGIGVPRSMRHAPRTRAISSCCWDRRERSVGSCGSSLTASWLQRYARASSVARAAPRVRRRLARHRHELPAVGAVVQRELQHAVHTADPCLAVRSDQRVGAIEPLAPGAHDDLADPVYRIGYAGGRLRGEPLVVAHMGVDDQLRSGGREVVPERLHRARR